MTLWMGSQLVKVNNTMAYYPDDTTNDPIEGTIVTKCNITVPLCVMATMFHLFSAKAAGSKFRSMIFSLLGSPLLYLLRTQLCWRV